MKKNEPTIWTNAC